MEVIVGLGIFFILITAVFIAVAVFLPEWLGITGGEPGYGISSAENPTKDKTEN